MHSVGDEDASNQQVRDVLLLTVYILHLLKALARILLQS